MVVVVVATAAAVSGVLMTFGLDRMAVLTLSLKGARVASAQIMNQLHIAVAACTVFKQEQIESTLNGVALMKKPSIGNPENRQFSH